MIFVGERKLFEKSFSFPHTLYLSKTLKRGGRISYDCLAASYEFRYASHSYDLTSSKLKLHRQSYHNACVSKLITCEALITLN